MLIKVQTLKKKYLQPNFVYENRPTYLISFFKNYISSNYYNIINLILILEFLNFICKFILKLGYHQSNSRLSVEFQPDQ